MSSRAADIIGRIETIGTVPTSVAQVFGLINDPKASVADFERVVRPDVGLTTNLLRCANSAYYRASREITSVRDAITRMGMRRVFEVAAGATFAKAVPEVLNGYGITAVSYWEHSVAVAVLADRLGRAAGFTYPDLAFTAGLLHDLGKLVVATWLDTNPAIMVPAGGLVTLELEHKVLGATHAEFGEALCQKWNLPRDIGGAARWHHAPADAPSATLRYLSTVVLVADDAAHRSGYGDASSAELEPEALERLSLDGERVQAVVEAAKPEIVRTQELLAQATGRRARAA
ncbi:MAG: HDOD domain-containing protein [Archangium sp.]|nr:HDOD domain-containing protein [Archangium sp.]